VARRGVVPAILLANKVASRADKRAAKAGPSLLAASHRLPEAALPEPQAEQAEQAVQPHDHSRARAVRAATLRREVLPLQAAADQVAAAVRRVRPVQPEPPARAAAR
jgi:hypothetical protein